MLYLRDSEELKEEVIDRNGTAEPITRTARTEERAGKGKARCRPNGEQEASKHEFATVQD